MQIKERSFDNKSQDYDKICIYNIDITRKIPIFFHKVCVFGKISKVPRSNSS